MNRFFFTWAHKHPNGVPVVILLLGLVFVTFISLACNAPANDGQTEATQIAIKVQETQLSLQENTGDPQNASNTPSAANESPQDSNATQTARAATQIAIDVQSTINAQVATEAAMTTATTLPTATIAPPDPAEPTAPPSSDQAPPSVDEMMEDADILLYENVTKIPLPRYIKQALDNLGLSRNYVDTKDATGNFKAQLLSGIDWDLVIAGVEARSAIQGEFFDYFNDQANDGTAVILELWDLDDIAGAKATAFLTNCGLKVQGDWYDPPLTSRSIWWLYGEHPIFHEPNEGMSLVNYNPYWFGDTGDLLKTIPGSDAILLAGTYAQEKNSYGLLATCHDGRVIIQTYSSHDYRQDDVVRLWENFIYNALRSRFEYELSQSNQ
ncbi:MAG: hypothetical protein ACK2U1_18235 [Anaerolineales bacterium]